MPAVNIVFYALRPFRRRLLVRRGEYEPITAEDISIAKERIIRARGTHVDSLMERLKEPRVRRVVEPVILGKMQGAPRNDDDYRYVLDLGILREDGKGSLVPGNPMYAEIMLRYLTFDEQENFKMRYGTPFWLKGDGSLDMPALMAEFQRFWRENCGADREVYGYNEATPHLVMMGYLQRVVNGGGRIAREMALGSKRLDLCVEFGKFRADRRGSDGLDVGAPPEADFRAGRVSRRAKPRNRR